VPEAATAALRLVADVVIQVGDERGSTTARLTGDETGLVLDVPDPATLVRCVPRRTVPAALLRAVPTERLVGIPVRVTSRGRNLARVEMTSAGRFRVQPSVFATPALLRSALSSASSASSGSSGSSRSRRLAAGVAAVVVVGVLAYLGRRRARS
jgi:hypothetical protein